MSEHPPGSLGFFRDHVPETGDALVGLIDTLYDECALDPKLRAGLVFLGIQAALRLPRAIRLTSRGRLPPARPKTRSCGRSPSPCPTPGC